MVLRQGSGARVGLSGDSKQLSLAAVAGFAPATPSPGCISPKAGSSRPFAARGLAYACATLARTATSVILFGVAQLSPATSLGQPSANSADPDFVAVRQLLLTPEERIDLAKVKLLVDHMIDPSIDVARTISQLDAMAQEIRAKLPIGASSRLTMDALRYHIYQPNRWNGNRPFQYDLDDPYGENLHNKLLPTYLATRRGNCISMPLLFIILGQKLGIDVTAATAPNHLYVKYRDSGGELYNLEATSGAGFTRDAWLRQQFAMSNESLASGVYMRALTRKETVGAILDTLLESYDKRGMQQRRIEMAQLALQFNPKNVIAILHQHQAYLALWRQEFVTLYPELRGIPEEKRPRLLELQGHLKALYERAYALGWRPLNQAADDRYRQSIKRARLTQEGGKDDVKVEVR